LHNVILDQYTISVGKSDLVHGDGLYGSTLFEFEKRRAISTAFLALPTIKYGECLATNF